MKNVLILFAWLMGTSLGAQDLIEQEFVKTIPRDEIDIAAQIFGIPFRADHAVDVFRILYFSVDAKGERDTLSGMLAVPAQTTGELPIILFQHGTTDGRWDVPSSGEFFNILLEVGFAAKGFVVSSADYVGMGVSDGFHPYVHAATEASAGIDMVSAARIACSRIGVTIDDHLFIAGYSQGGHAAMAAHRALQEMGSPGSVTASAPMSGPYSISDEMKRRILSDEVYTYPAYLPYLLHGYQTVYGDLYQDLTEFYREPYATIIREELLREDYSIGFLNDTLNRALMFHEGAMRPKLMFQDSIIEGVRNDPDHRINRALRDNDVYDWVPDVPVRMFYCESDEQVVYTNATFTDSLMNARGARDVASESVGSQYGHRECAPHALLAAIEFFSSFLVMPNQEDRARDLPFEVFPNPVSEQLNILLESELEDAILEICDITGREWYASRAGAIADLAIPVGHLPAGVYVVVLRSGNNRVVDRFIKQ